MKIFNKKQGYTFMTDDEDANFIIQRLAEEYRVRGELINVYKQDKYYIITFVTTEKRKRIHNMLRIIFRNWKYDLCFKDNIIGIYLKDEAK